MSEIQTDKIKPRQFEHGRRHLCIAFGIFAAFIIWWFYIRAGGPTFSPWVTWNSNGTSGTITFYVTHRGAPVAGVKLDTESFSGTSGEEFTDSSGMATFRPGESEVVSIYIDGREIPLRPLPLGEEFFLPSCYPHGLAFHVSL